MFNFITYNKFKERKWRRLEPRKRLQVFQKLENIQAKKMKRPAYTVVAANWEDENLNGQCTNDKQIIQLNSKFVFNSSLRFLGMATLFHEGRHAFQHHVCFGKKKVRRFTKAYKWRNNFLGYVNGENDKYSFYSMQPIERDANKYAIIRMKKFRHRFRREPLFNQALMEKVEDFANTKDLAKKELGMFYKLRVALRNNKERRKR